MQNVINQHSMDIVDAAHLIAMGELVTTDAGIGCFDSKYFYLAWRPITAIQNADKDGNPDTTADPGWAAAAAHTHPSGIPLGARLPDQRLHRRARSGTAHQPPQRHHPRRDQRRHHPRRTTRQYNNTNDIQNQIIDARVWIGFHFRNSTEQGLNLGNNIADWALDRYFQPAKH